MDVKFWVVGFLVPVSVLTQLSAEEVSPRDSTEIQAVSPEISEPARAVDTIVLSEDEMEEAENRLEDSLDALEDRLEDSVRVSEAKIDTIDASELESKISYGVQAFTRFISKSRAQGYGGGVVLQPLLLGLHLKPVYDLAHRDRVLKAWDFPDLVDGYSPVLTIGALFYGGVGKGTRVGFGGWKGDLFFGSEEQESDSIMVLKVETLYGGLLLEKVFLKGNMNFFVGGIVGGGKINVDRGYQSANAFKAVWDRYNDKTEKAEAVFTGFEIHSGFTVTVLPWMHLGADVNGLLMLSLNGFGTGRGFISFNPGVRLRLTLGNLG